MFVSIHCLENSKTVTITCWENDPRPVSKSENSIRFVYSKTIQNNCFEKQSTCRMIPYNSFYRNLKEIVLPSNINIDNIEDNIIIKENGDIFVGEMKIE